MLQHQKVVINLLKLQYLNRHAYTPINLLARWHAEFCRPIISALQLILTYLWCFLLTLRHWLFVASTKYYCSYKQLCYRTNTSAVFPATETEYTSSSCNSYTSSLAFSSCHLYILFIELRQWLISWTVQVVFWEFRCHIGAENSVNPL